MNAFTLSHCYLNLFHSRLFLQFYFYIYVLLISDFSHECSPSFCLFFWFPDFFMAPFLSPPPSHSLSFSPSLSLSLSFSFSLCLYKGSLRFMYLTHSLPPCPPTPLPPPNPPPPTPLFQYLFLVAMKGL